MDSRLQFPKTFIRIKRKDSSSFESPPARQLPAMRNNSTPISPVTPQPPALRFNIVGSKRLSNERKAASDKSRTFTSRKKVRVQASTATFAIGSVRNPRRITYVGAGIHNNDNIGLAAASVSAIRIAGDPTRTQFGAVKRTSGCGGALETRLLAALDDYNSAHIYNFVEPRSVFIQSFRDIPTHSRRVSFLARCCCRFSDSRILILVDANNSYAFMRLAEVKEEDMELIDNILDTPAVWKDVKVDHRTLPRPLLLFLLNQSTKTFNLIAGDVPTVGELGIVPVFKR